MSLGKCTRSLQTHLVMVHSMPCTHEVLHLTCDIIRTIPVNTLSCTIAVDRNTSHDFTHEPVCKLFEVRCLSLQDV